MVAALTMLLAIVGTVSASPAGAHSATNEIREITLPIAVSAVDDVHWSDTFGAPRSGGRTHIGVDILGPQMTPLVAARDGVVTWLRHDTVSGNNLVITDAEGWTYHYIHINNDTPGTDDGANAYEHAFAPGIVDGAVVTAGQVVAYMGDSGNAENCCSHLHFEIEAPDGHSINPTPSVDYALSRIGLTQFEVDPALIAPHSTTDGLVTDIYTTLLGRFPSLDERQQFSSAVVGQGLAAVLTDFVDADSSAAGIDRLYFSVFLRLPDFGGYRYWIDRNARDLDLASISDFFADSPEYKERFEGKSFDDLLDQIYLEMFDRPPDAGGKAYWLDRLADPDDPVTRGTVIAFFSDSAEAKDVAALRNELVALTALYEDRMPTAAEIAQWEATRASTSLPAATSARFLSS